MKQNKPIRVIKTDTLTSYDNIYFPVLDMDGNKFSCVCITGNKDTDFQPIVDHLTDIIWRQYRSPHNYGLAYFASGYNSEGQNNFIKTCYEKFGVDVF